MENPFDVGKLRSLHSNSKSKLVPSVRVSLGIDFDQRQRITGGINYGMKGSFCNNLKSQPIKMASILNSSYSSEELPSYLAFSRPNDPKQDVVMKVQSSDAAEKLRKSWVFQHVLAFMTDTEIVRLQGLDRFFYYVQIPRLLPTLPIR